MIHYSSEKSATDTIRTNLRNIRNSGYHYNYCDNENVIIISLIGAIYLLFTVRALHSWPQ